MKFSRNILHTYSFILSIIKHNWKIRRFWVADPVNPHLIHSPSLSLRSSGVHQEQVPPEGEGGCPGEPGGGAPAHRLLHFPVVRRAAPRGLRQGALCQDRRREKQRGGCHLL